MAKVNLEKMSLDELKSLQKDVQGAIQNYEKRRKIEARKAVEAVAKEHGMTLSEILGNGRKTKQATTPKYKNPANPSQTWSGRGRQPAWYKDAIAAGKKPKSLEV